jgi:hypothetical protein
LAVAKIDLNVDIFLMAFSAAAATAATATTVARREP